MNEEINVRLRNDIEVGKQELARQGIPASGKRLHRALAEADQRARDEADARFGLDQEVNVATNQRIRKLNSKLAVVFVAVFMLAGVLALVFMFPAAEYAAVREGILAFTDNGFLAAFNSATVVLGLVVLLFIKNLLRDNLPNDVAPASSLRISALRLLYWVGWSTDRPTNSRAEELYLGAVAAVRTLQLVILFLGFQGRAADAMVGADGTYFSFLGDLITGATPVEFFGYVGTAVLTWALLRVTDLVVLYIYTVFVNAVGTLDIGGTDKAVVSRFLITRSLQLRLNAINDLVVDATERNRRRQEQQNLPNDSTGS